MTKIAITGIGVVSTFGLGRETFWDHVRRGVSGTRAITEFDATSYPCRVAAAVPPLTMDSAQRLEGETQTQRQREWACRSEALLACGALRRARRTRGVARRRPLGGRAQRRRDHRHRRRRHRHRRAPVSGLLHQWRQARDAVRDRLGICGMVSSEISISLGLHGISHVLSTGCTSSTDAIGYAAMLLRSGEFDVLLSGGTDGCVLPGMIFGFSRMRAVSTHYNDRPETASRPFDRGRDGFVLGEGAWMVVARARRSRARPEARESTRRSTATPARATPTIACRWILTASRSCAA